MYPTRASDISQPHPHTHIHGRAERHKGMYNGSILAMPRRINDEVEEREIIREGLSSLN